jgi:hypothetical protein
MQAQGRLSLMFRFTIRELVLVTVIVALGAAWWQARLQSSPVLAKQVEQLKAAIESSEKREARMRISYVRYIEELEVALRMQQEARPVASRP